MKLHLWQLQKSSFQGKNSWKVQRPVLAPRESPTNRSKNNPTNTEDGLGGAHSQSLGPPLTNERTNHGKRFDLIWCMHIRKACSLQSTYPYYQPYTARRPARSRGSVAPLNVSKASQFGARVDASFREFRCSLSKFPSEVGPSHPTTPAYVVRPLREDLKPRQKVPGAFQIQEGQTRHSR